MSEAAAGKTVPDARIVTIRVFRYDPALSEPTYQDYAVPLTPHLTVIRALFHLAAHADDPPAFRRFMCNRGQCAGCVMTINGRTRRACTTEVRDGMVIEPLYDYPVIKDLVVDFGRKRLVGNRMQVVRRGAFVLRSRAKRRANPPLVRVAVDHVTCDTCPDKPCVAACWVNRIGNLATWEGERLAPLSGPIRLVNGRAELPGICRECGAQPCMDKCPAQAFSLVADGAGTRIEPKRCIGCGLCAGACPYGSIWLNLERGHAVKCDLCGGDPQCVKACPFGALSIDTAAKTP